MMMTRNVIITGDDFQHIPCGPESVCKCTTPGKFCTVGLHTLVNGTNTPYGGTYKLKYTRVEKCGQRGILGRYCIHFHAMRECPDCLIKGMKERRRERRKEGEKECTDCLIKVILWSMVIKGQL